MIPAEVIRAVVGTAAAEAVVIKADRLSRCSARGWRSRLTGLSGAVRCVVLLLWVLGAGVAFAEEREVWRGADRKWRHVRSEHFEVYSGTSESSAREILHQLELLRAVFLEKFGFRERLPLPVTVYDFDRKDDFRAYLPEGMRSNEFFSGLYFARADRAVILFVQSTEAEAARRIVLHEFVHHLFRVAGETPALWFNEGMADLLSTLVEEQGRVVLGRPHTSRLAALRTEKFMPLATLFARDRATAYGGTEAHTGLFYAESWALLHYLQFGQTELPADKVKVWLARAQRPAVAGNPAVMAALSRELLGMELPVLQERLERYALGGRYREVRIPAPAIPAEKTYVVRPVERQEMRERLAELALRTNRSPAAKLAMLGWSEARPGDARLHEALGQEARSDGDAEGAGERWRRAIEAGTANAAVFHELAQMEARRWFTRLDLGFRLPPERAAEFRTLLERSIAAAPDQSAAYETLAWVEATAEEPVVKNINLVQERFATLVDKPRTLLAMASVRERRGDKGTALELLKALDSMEPGPQIATAAETLRAKLEGRKPRRIAPKGAPQKTIPPSALPPIQAPAMNLPEKR